MEGLRFSIIYTVNGMDHHKQTKNRANTKLDAIWTLN